MEEEEEEEDSGGRPTDCCCLVTALVGIYRGANLSRVSSWGANTAGRPITAYRLGNRLKWPTGRIKKCFGLGFPSRVHVGRPTFSCKTYLFNFPWIIKKLHLDFAKTSLSHELIVQKSPLLGSLLVGTITMKIY